MNRGSFHAQFQWDRTDQQKIPNEPKILTFRDLIELAELREYIYCFTEDYDCEAAKAHLKERGIGMKHGTIFDDTLIAASSSIKHKEGKRE